MAAAAWSARVSARTGPVAAREEVCTSDVMVTLLLGRWVTSGLFCPGAAGSLCTRGPRGDLILGSGTYACRREGVPQTQGLQESIPAAEVLVIPPRAGADRSSSSCPPKNQGALERGSYRR